jgi:mono/diheme cytochrome c family protein
MKPGIIGAVCAVFAILSFSPAVRAQQGDAVLGKATYLSKCGTCHRENGEPNATLANLLKVEIPHLASETVQDMADADLKKVMVEGKEKMQPVKDLSEADISNVLAYIRTLDTR